MPEKRKTPAFVSRLLLASFCFQNQAILVIPAGFEPTACRLGGDRSILLSYGTMSRKPFIFKAFRILRTFVFWKPLAISVSWETVLLAGGKQWRASNLSSDPERPLSVSSLAAVQIALEGKICP